MNGIVIPILGISVGLVAVLGWIFTTWLRIKNGYPLDDHKGKATIYPRRDEENAERVRLLSTENAQLRAELGSIKDRLANVERIVTDANATDGGGRLAREIEGLRGAVN